MLPELVNILGLKTVDDAVDIIEYTINIKDCESVSFELK